MIQCETVDKMLILINILLIRVLLPEYQIKINFYTTCSYRP